MLVVLLAGYSGGQDGRPPTTLTGEFTFAATGDSILLRPVSVYEREPAFSTMVELLRGTTVAFTNFEFLTFDTRRFRPTPQAEHGGLWLHGTPREAREVQWLGFDMVSRANNHTTDYGVEGMLETTAILDDLGIVHAGSGRDLGEARAPAYFHTPVGRVAMISCASSHTPMSRAGHTRPDIKGRPGLSMLRWTRHVYLDNDTYDRLKGAVEAMNLSREPNPFTDEEMNVFGTRFKKGDEARVELVANERDQEEILAQVRSARRQADFVFVTIHAHEPGNYSETPADFLPRFARATMDAGADMFIGHGPHQVRAVEIYRDRPIFYSLGNFLFQFQTLEPQPADAYERFELDLFENTIGDLYDATEGKTLEFKEDIWWEGVIALSRFERDKLVGVELHPVDLGASLPRPQRGTPRLADEALARKIIERMARLSDPYGTTITFDGRIGIVELTASTN
jgi:poly-gamma-glutamate synthesis protein (capsule biosynthesis protein)